MACKIRLTCYLSKIVHRATIHLSKKSSLTLNVVDPHQYWKWCHQVLWSVGHYRALFLLNGALLVVLVRRMMMLLLLFLLLFRQKNYDAVDALLLAVPSFGQHQAYPSCIQGETALCWDSLVQKMGQNLRISNTQQDAIAPGPRLLIVKKLVRRNYSEVFRLHIREFIFKLCIVMVTCIVVDQQRWPFLFGEK